MASVKQQREHGNWYICYKVPTGKVNKRGRPVFRYVQQWTEYTDGVMGKAEALRRAIDYELLAVATAKKQFNENKARNFVEEMARQSAVTVSHTKSPRQHLEKWLASRKLIVAEKTYANYDDVIADFLEFTESHHIVSVADVSHTVVTDFRDDEIRRGKSVATINKALSILGQAFEACVVNGELPRNPVRGLRLTKIANRPAKVSRRAFSTQQFAELVAKVHPEEKSKRGRLLHADWQTFILLLGYTGGRQQEVAKLRYRDIQLDENRIMLYRTKSYDGHPVPIHSALRRHLEERGRVAHSAEDLVMPYIGEQKGRALSKQFREVVLPRIGISQPYNKRATAADSGNGEPPKVGRQAAEYSLHSLRHSLSTWLHAQGVSEMTRMRLVGHEDVEVSRAYTHEEHEQLQAALATIPDVLATRHSDAPRARRGKSATKSAGRLAASEA